MTPSRSIIVLAAVAALGCSKKKAETDETSDVATSTAAEPAEPTPWWETATPCPDGAMLMKANAPRRAVYCEKDGVRHGPYSTLRPDGRVRVSGQFEGGVRSGTWTHLGPDGKTLGSYELEGGTGTVTEWRDDGRVSLTFTVESGKKQGAWTRYHAVTPEGTDSVVKQEHGSYENDYRTGTWTYWSPTGVRVREIDYKKGLPSVTRHYDATGKVTRTERAGLMKLEPATLMKLESKLANLGPDALSTKGLAGAGPVGARRPPPSKVKVRIGSLAVAGEMEQVAVRKVLMSRRRAIRACYERELQRNPGLAGVMDLRFTIMADGRVAARLTGKGPSQRVSDCVKRQVMRMKFPLPRDRKRVTVSAKIAFASG